jgi:fluoride exporter
VPDQRYTRKIAMTKLFLIALAGAVGTLARYGLTLGCTRLFGDRMPVGTLLVNLVGCALFGFVLALFRDRARLGPESATVLLVGFMGAFTTFSSFVSDSHALWTDRPALAVANVVVQNLVGFGCFVLGQNLGRAGW